MYHVGLRSTPIILVGNGRSLKGRRLGEVIDLFPTIVRFNNFQIEGHEEDVGTRIGWWARSQLGDIRDRPEPFTRVILRMRGESLDWWQNDLKNIFLPLVSKYPLTPVETISLETYDRVFREFDGNVPQTGPLVIEHLLQFYDRLYVVGFDCLEGGLREPKHYFGKSTNGDVEGCHNPTAERKYLSRLVEEGKLVIL